MNRPLAVITLRFQILPLVLFVSLAGCAKKDRASPGCAMVSVPFPDQPDQIDCGDSQVSRVRQLEAFQSCARRAMRTSRPVVFEQSQGGIDYFHCERITRMSDGSIWHVHSWLDISFPSDAREFKGIVPQLCTGVDFPRIHSDSTSFFRAVGCEADPDGFQERMQADQ